MLSLHKHFDLRRHDQGIRKHSGRNRDSDDQKKTTLFKDLQRDPPPAPQTSHRLPQPTEPPASAYLVSPYYPESVHCWRPRKDNTGKIKYGACWGPLQTGKRCHVITREESQGRNVTPDGRGLSCQRTTKRSRD